MTVISALGRTCHRLGYAEKLVLAATAAISAPLLAVMAAGAIGDDPGVERMVGWAFGATAVATLGFVWTARRLLEPVRSATRQLGAYLERREMPETGADLDAGHDEASQLLAEVAEACHRMEWERMILEGLAVVDPESGALNRRGALDRISTLRDAAPGAARWTVAVVDIDDLRTLNDRHGHDAGDQALRLVADRLEALPIPQTIVSRWAGDEFLVVSPCRVEAMELALTNVIDELRRTSVLDDMPAFVTFSAGLARGRIHDSLDGPLELADEALRAARRAGGARVVHAGPRLVRFRDGIRA